MQTCKTYHFKIEPLEPWQEILMAHLSQMGFDSFEETQDGLDAYSYNPAEKSELEDLIHSLEEAKISYTTEDLPEINWNEVWEKNYQPIEIENQLRIRAEFHPPKSGFEYELIIQPKMSFGTGHHETTTLMLMHMLEIDFIGKKVLDMGCGTAILAIFAATKEAKNVDAFDIEEHIIENATENAQKNNAKVNVFLGNADSLVANEYDYILANINRNVLMMDLYKYVSCLKIGGTLLLSGFLEQDKTLLEEKATAFGLEKVAEKNKNNWMAIRWKKTS